VNAGKKSIAQIKREMRELEDRITSIPQSVRDQYNREHGSATRMQAMYRGFKVRNESEFRQERMAAAAGMQRLARGRQARNKVDVMRDDQLRAKTVLRIQSLYRGGVERSIVADDKAGKFVQCNILRFVAGLKSFTRGSMIDMKAQEMKSASDMVTKRTHQLDAWREVTGKHTMTEEEVAELDNKTRKKYDAKVQARIVKKEDAMRAQFDLQTKKERKQEKKQK
jgi:hypothetical protein